MGKIKLGILGVSNHFLKRIILPLIEIDTIEVYGIASRDIKRAELIAIEFNIENWYGSYEELLNDDNIDTVYIPLPNHLHLDYIKKAASVGKNILCEKPLTLNAKEAHEAFSFVQEKGVKLMEAFMYRFHPQWQYVRDLVRTNQIGKVNYINVVFSYNNSDSKNIRNIQKFGGGAMMDIGCYAISVPRFILGQEPRRVISLIDKSETFRTDVLSSAILDFGSSRASFTVGTLSDGFQKVDIIGTSGRISIEIPFNTYVDVPAKITVVSPVGERTVGFEPFNQYGLMFKAFANSIINDQEVPTPIVDAINNLKVLDAVVESGEKDCWVEINN